MEVLHAAIFAVGIFAWLLAGDIYFLRRRPRRPDVFLAAVVALYAGVGYGWGVTLG